MFIALVPFSSRTDDARLAWVIAGPTSARRKTREPEWAERTTRISSVIRGLFFGSMSPRLIFTSHTYQKQRRLSLETERLRGRFLVLKFLPVFIVSRTISFVKRLARAQQTISQTQIYASG